MNSKHLRVIREIQGRIPKELLMKLTKKEVQAPTVKKVLEIALTKPDEEITPRQKRRIQALLDSGKLDREVEVLDHEVEKLIDVFIEDEIANAVKLGRLPKHAPKLALLKNKGKKYAKKQEKRLRKEFLGEDNDEANSSKNSEEGEGEHPTRSSDGGLLLELGN